MSTKPSVHAGAQKICSRCETLKTLDAYRVVARHLDGRSHVCIACTRNQRNTTRRARYKNNSTASKVPRRRLSKRELQLRSRYGITLQEYDAIRESQGNACRLCERPFPEGASNRRIALDHCHATGRVRGLLCTRCNTGLGALGDDVAGLQRATAYVAGPTLGTSAGLLF